MVGLGENVKHVAGVAWERVTEDVRQPHEAEARRQWRAARGKGRVVTAVLVVLVVLAQVQQSVSAWQLGRGFSVIRDGIGLPVAAVLTGALCVVVRLHVKARADQRGDRRDDDDSGLPDE